MPFELNLRLSIRNEGGEDVISVRNLIGLRAESEASRRSSHPQ